MDLPFYLYGTLMFMLGCCVGSFLNVVIWRLPHHGRVVEFHNQVGFLTLSWPPSHCPICDKPIHWYQNIPIVSWLVLRGRCVGCGTPISLRYPLVEFGTGLLYLAIFAAYFVTNGNYLGGSLWVVAWRFVEHPYFLHAFFITILITASAIDADWYIIPICLPALLAIVAVIVTPLLKVRQDLLPYLDPQGAWAWPMICAFFGLVMANIFVWLGWLPRSFSQYEQQEEERAAAKPEKKPAEDDRMPFAPPPRVKRRWPWVLATFLVTGGGVASWFYLKPIWAGPVSLFAGIVVFLIGVLPRQDETPDVTQDVEAEIAMPNARAEILKELLFLLFPLIGGLIGLAFPHMTWLVSPIPLGRFLGIMGGFLIGGGVVWGVRVLGSLAFGKEAMGLGDVHLMAAVGCILGAANVTLAFMLAPFFGLMWAAILAIARRPNILPYGPWLSVSSILCLLAGKPIIGWYLRNFMSAS